MKTKPKIRVNWNDGPTAQTVMTLSMPFEKGMKMIREAIKRFDHHDAVMVSIIGIEKESSDGK